jgi:hypothetical protein
VGQAAALKALSEKTRVDIETWHAPIVAGLTRQLDSLRARQRAALEGAPKDPASALVGELRARECRDLARSLDDTARLAFFMRGNREVRNALMAAPDPILPAEVVEAERVRLLAEVDAEAADQLEDATAVAAIYAHAAEVALRSVEDATGHQVPGAIEILK